MANSNLTNAKKTKNDEFYTQYSDIQKEINAYLEYDAEVFRGKTILLPCDDPEWSNFTRYFSQNFERLGLKKLISTSFAANSKQYSSGYQPSPFETNNSQYDEKKSVMNGKIFTLTEDMTNDGKINIEDLQWEYLKGDGDFRSDEIKALRDEADIIVTNPPFSLFREFVSWIIEANKKLLVLGNIHAIIYKEIFPFIKNDRLWLGPSITSGDRVFEVPKGIVDMSKFTGEIREEKYYQKVMGVRWFTNLDHGRRHQPLSLMTMEENLKFSKRKEIKGKSSYRRYDNYDAIEVPFTEAIPSDYEGVMGVPVSFLDKYNPDQFELIGSNRGVGQDPNRVYGQGSFINSRETFKRIFIKHKRQK